MNLDAMRSDISSAFMTSDFDWRSAILTCEAVKFPMLCSLTERVQEDLDSEFERVSPSTGVDKRMLPRFGEFCYCYCSPLLPQIA